MAQFYYACGACEYIGKEKPVCFSQDCYAIRMVIDDVSKRVVCDASAGHCRRGIEFLESARAKREV